MVPPGDWSILNTKDSLVYHFALRLLILKGLSRLATQALENIMEFFEVGCLFFLKHICQSSCLCVKMQVFWPAIGKRSLIKNKYTNLLWYFSSDVPSPSVHSFIYSFKLLNGCLLQVRNCLPAWEIAVSKTMSLLTESFYSRGKRQAISKEIMRFLYVRC